jgi:hypothetical protein
LIRDGLRIQPFNTSNATKTQVIESLQLAFERRDIRILNDPVLVSELMAYQADRTASGLLRYAAPAGGHDDMVIALALAWTAVGGQHRVIYTLPDKDLVVPAFSIPEHWPRAYGLDIRWNTAAAIWGARDPESGVLYLYDEYLSDADPDVHVTAIRARGEWIFGLIDPAGNARDQADGQSLLQMHRNLGLNLQSINNSLESGILDVRQLMNSGSLKVFDSLTKFLEERRIYRRDERNQVVKDQDHLMDATRCLVIGRSRVSTKPKPSSPMPPRDYGPRGWMV